MPVHGKAYGAPPTAFPKTLEIESTDFHIPSAPTTAAHLTENQNPDRRMIAPPAQMISSSSIPAASQKIRFLMIDNNTTRLLDFVNRYADPPSAVGVSKFTIDGQRIVALDVPEFAEVPTICKADLNAPNNQAVLKRGATYIRTERASSEGVSTADAMRDLMNRAVVKRGDQLLKMVERLIKGKPLELDEDAARQVENEIQAGSQFLIENLPPEFGQSGRWEIEFSVLPYVQERVHSFRAIADALQASQVTLRGWYFPHFDRDNTSNFAQGVQSFTSDRGMLRRHLEGYRAYQSGGFV